MSDLAWYQEGRQPTEYVIFQIGPNRFYRVDDIKAFLRLKDNADFLQNLVMDNQLVFDFPLMVGKKFCGADAITRPDSLYCWFVDGETRFRRPVQGVQPSSSRSEFSLRFVTNPDDVHILFVPGIGITRYEYRHHGTPSAVDAELIEYSATARPK